MNPDPSTQQTGNGTGSLYWTMLLVLIGLIFMTSSRINTIWGLRTSLAEKNRMDTAVLEKSGDQVRFTEKLEDALRKLAMTDTVAARILVDYFPPAMPPPPEFQIRKDPAPVLQNKVNR